VDACLPPGTDVLRVFSFVVCYGGLAFDALLPLVLLSNPSAARRGTALACVVLFNVCNKLWFGLGVFPWLNIFALFLFARAASPAGPAGRVPSRLSGAAVWRARLVAFLAIPHVILPFRHLVFYGGERSALWTDEGHLYSWRMKLVERRGWVLLEVTDAASGRAWRLAPETDTALHPDQAGELAHNPLMLLRYSEHLRDVFALRGVPGVSVHAVGSCVSANGRPAQPLFMSHANLLEHAANYSSIQAAVQGLSGVHRFLHPWGAGTPGSEADRCELGAAPPGQRESDEAYRWLYAPLFARPHKSSWPWSGWSRVPKESGSCLGDPLHPPTWATMCSFLHAAGGEGGVWCPHDHPTDATSDDDDLTWES
jgi:hypothetical protein